MNAQMKSNSFRVIARFVVMVSVLAGPFVSWVQPGLAGPTSVAVPSGSHEAGDVEHGQMHLNSHLPTKHRQALPGDRLVIGTVYAVGSGHIKVDTGTLQHLFLPVSLGKEKGLGPINRDDLLVITLNEQNLLVDYHRVVSNAGEHRIVSGQLAQTLRVGHDRAVIRLGSGEDNSYKIRPLTRSKVAAIPVGIPALFLLDETLQIVDVTFADNQALELAKKERKHISPPKAPHRRVEGIMVAVPNQQSAVAIQGPDGDRQVFEVRPLAWEELSQKPDATEVILMIDTENHVIDAAFPPTGSTAWQTLQVVRASPDPSRARVEN